MTTALLSLPIFRAFDTAGLPLAGGLLYSYAANTLTFQNTYSDNAGSSPNTNPVVLDSTGSAVVRLDPTLVYKFVLKTSTGTTLWTVDYYQADNLTASSIGAILYPQTAAEIAAGVTPTNYGYEFGDILRYGGLGDNSHDDTTAIQNAVNCCPSGGVVTFHAGTYIVTNTITLKSAAMLLGAGQDSTIISYNGAAAAVSMAGLTKCNLRDISVIGGNTASSCVDMNGSTLCTLINVGLRNSTVGAAVTSGNENLFVQVAANQNSQDGFWFSTNANNCTLVGCEAVGNTRAGLYSQGSRQLAVYSSALEANGYGVYLTTTGSGTTRATSVNINGCYIEGNSTYEVYSLSGGSSLVPRGISIRDTYFVHIAGKATTAIRIEDIEGIVMDGCTFDDVGGAYTYSCIVNNAGIATGIEWGYNTDKSTNGIVVNAGRSYLDLKKSTARAWGRFTVSGAAIATSNMYLCSVAYISAGVYEVTLATAMSGTNYAITASCENGASAQVWICAPGAPVSTTVFRLFTASVSGVAADARTVCFEVHDQ